MIAFLKGKLAGKTPQVAYIDVNGVGYAVFMSATALSKLPESGGAVTVLTYLQVSDAGIALYGFLSEEEKATFERLIGVTGVGPKVALAALSTFSRARWRTLLPRRMSRLCRRSPAWARRAHRASSSN